MELVAVALDGIDPGVAAHAASIAAALADVAIGPHGARGGAHRARGQREFL
jgi:hypothetical protein